MKIDYRTNFKWQEKLDKNYGTHKYENYMSFSNQPSLSLKQISNTKYEIDINFVYYDYEHNTYEKIITKKIYYYIKRNKNRDIDWILTDKRQFNSTIFGNFQDLIIKHDVTFNNKIIASFGDTLYITDIMYKKFLRIEKLKSLID